MKTRSPQSEIPTSSTADIAFLLVIFFMLTMTFTATRGIDYAPPEDEETPTIDPLDAILLEVLADGSLEVDGKAVTADELDVYLGEKLRDRPDKPVILHTAPAAPYRRMVELYDHLHLLPEQLGLEQPINVAIPTEREVASYWP